MNTSEEIRNFSIIAHIDHGKSTLADRLLEETGTISERNMKKQILDSLDLERERGITVKLKAVRMVYKYCGKKFILNLIDTPGHIDFSYEVSRSLAACEGAVLLVDASEGVEAQTITNAKKAINLGLSIIPVVNKIDLENADVEGAALELSKTFGFKKDEILFISAKKGYGVPDLLGAIISRIPPPREKEDGKFRALVFDSFYNDYFGVVANIRVFSGSLRKGERVYFVKGGRKAVPVQMGYLTPHMVESPILRYGEVGFIATGIKDIKKVRVGDTVVRDGFECSPLEGYKEPKPVVFLSFYPQNSSQINDLRGALEKLSLTDASLSVRPESGGALGRGFRCGFLGLFHAEIIKERLEREYGLNIVSTVPSVLFKVKTVDGKDRAVSLASEFPQAQSINYVEEPYCSVSIYTPIEYLGRVMDLCISKRAEFKSSEYNSAFGSKRMKVTFSMPLSELITDLHDKLKSVSSGYASLNYEFQDYRRTSVVKLDILIAGEKVDFLSRVVHKDLLERTARRIVKILKEELPRRQFQQKIQAVVNGKIIARETVSAVRKDVTEKLYGGDVTRKKKLLEKQKKGKKKLRDLGKAVIPKDIFWKVAKI